jgi:adenylylsulfate kinase
VLDLNQIRRAITHDPADPDAEREVLYRALVSAARRLTEAGVPVLIDATGHRRAWRALARELIPAFAEVELRCPPEVCRQRQQRRRTGPRPAAVDAADAQGAETGAGVDIPYEAATAPDLALDTAACDRWTQLQSVVYLAERMARQAAAAPPVGARDREAAR